MAMSTDSITDEPPRPAMNNAAMADPEFWGPILSQHGVGASYYFDQRLLREPPHGYLWAHVGLAPLPRLVSVRHFHDRA